MTRNYFLFKSFEEYNEGMVTFKDGKRSKIIGKDFIQVEAIPKIEEVSNVKGLKANLIRITQICDNNFILKFTNNHYVVIDQIDKCMLKGTRSYDNYY